MLPPVTDYSKQGPFAPTMVVNNTGPDGMYTMHRPTTLGANGFKHPPLTWGNGVTTTPAQYPTLLATIASHGFVVIASNSSSVTAQMMTAGLDWLIAQDAAAGPFQGKLDTMRAVSMGYSLGGGAALTTGAHKSVIATIAMHPAPGGGSIHGPVLLYTGTDDTVVAPALVMSSYTGLRVPGFLATLQGATHFEPVGAGGRELAPSIAWLRLWVFNDEGAKKFFYGDDCTLCVMPWTKQTNAMWK
jgi:pimeloyl-ACP methyl ester carboxylesterase